MNEPPLISCLTVTSNRLRLLKEAIACYLTQTWPHRELVIVSGGEASCQRALTDYLEWLGRDDIRLFFTPGDISLGAMRNLSIDHARGDVICQWDDDDLYHPQRLELQFRAMEEAQAGACFLTDHLQFYTLEQEMFWLDWSIHGNLGADKELVSFSMMARRDVRLRYPESGHDSRLGEDNVYRAALLEAHPAVPLSGLGCLYVYRFHGRNILPQNHHRRMTEWAVGRPFFEQHADALRRALPAYRLPMPYQLKTGDGETVQVVNG